MRTGLIVVAYRVTSEQIASIVPLAARVDEMVVVDNTPTPDAALGEALAAADIPLLVRRNEGGLAGAYNAGAAVLVERGADLVFLLDQDSDIDDDFLDEMTNACRPLAGRPFVVGPLIYEVKLDTHMGLEGAPEWADVPDWLDGSLEPTRMVISSGSAVSAEGLARIGPFREDYVIESVDLEYSLRAWSLGVPVLLNRDVTLRQTMGDITRHGRRFAVNHDAVRCYYRARNYLRCLLDHESRAKAWRRAGRFALQQGATAARYESDKGAKVVATVVGLVDGARGRLGTLADRHPRLLRRVIARTS